MKEVPLEGEGACASEVWSGGMGEKKYIEVVWP